MNNQEGTITLISPVSCQLPNENTLDVDFFLKKAWNWNF
jgi:hypothetical protein